MSTKQFSSLVDLQERSCQDFAANRLFGTKVEGTYRWSTYAEFGKKVNHCRAAFAALEINAGDKVAVISNNRTEWAVAAYATYGRAGHYVPMYENQLAKDWRFIIEDSNAALVLAATKEIYEQIKPWVGELKDLRHVLCFALPEEHEDSWAGHLKKGVDNPVDSVEPKSDEICGLIYTSGTTGKPKGVMLTHGNIISNVNAIHEIFPIEDADVSLSFLPWAHSFGQTVELHVLLSMGSSLGLAESVKTLLDNFSEVRPTVLFAVPRIFNKIYDGLQKKMAKESAVKQLLFRRGLEVAEKRRELAKHGSSSFLLNLQYRFFDKIIFSKVRERFGGRLKYAVSGGAALSKEVGKFIDNMNISVFEGYGLTETSPITTANLPGASQIGTVGKPIPNVSVYICDEKGKPLPDGSEGELVVVGPNVMKGYHNREEATKEVIFDLEGKRAFKTGDMGMRQKDGFIRITGRFKEQYKLENGKYVVPSPIEEVLKLSGYINQVFLYGDNKLFNTCLIVPDFAAVRDWAAGEGISNISEEALIENQKVYALFGEELSKYGVNFKGYERPRKWTLLADEFSVENDMMTPKMSLKRRNIVKAYKDKLEALYNT